MDRRQADFVFLLRQDDSQVAVFNGWSASAVHIWEAANKDFRKRSSLGRVAGPERG